VGNTLGSSATTLNVRWAKAALTGGRHLTQPIASAGRRLQWNTWHRCKYAPGKPTAGKVTGWPGEGQGVSVSALVQRHSALRISPHYLGNSQICLVEANRHAVAKNLGIDLNFGSGCSGLPLRSMQLRQGLSLCWRVHLPFTTPGAATIRVPSRAS
jgi:hypothetical protein